MDAEYHMSGIIGAPCKQIETWKGTPWVRVLSWAGLQSFLTFEQ